MVKNINKNLQKLQTKGKSLFLAYDHGLEHGPEDLPDETLNPDYVFSIAEKGKFNGFIVQKGLAEKYGGSYKTNLILKVNGKTNIKNKDPYSPINCSVKKAVQLNAKAIGFTIYPGSEFEEKIYEDFRNIQEEAHDYGLPVIAWMYPRGKSIKNDLDKNILIRSARIGLELGADMLKMKYNGDKETLKIMKAAAGKAKLLCAGGSRSDTSKEFLKKIEEMNECGVDGFAIGRNIWKHEKPLKITNSVKDILFEKKNVYEALKRLEN